MTKYREEIEQGEAAFANDHASTDNPFAYQTTEWYAWDAGWQRAAEEHAQSIIDDLTRAGYTVI